MAGSWVLEGSLPFRLILLTLIRADGRRQFSSVLSRAQPRARTDLTSWRRCVVTTLTTRIAIISTDRMGLATGRISSRFYGAMHIPVISDCSRKPRIYGPASFES